MFVDVKPSFSIVEEEIFGPVVAAMPFDGDDVRVGRKQLDLRSGSRHLDQGHFQGPQNGQRIKAGSVWVNQYNGFDTAMPFGGYKQSGWGRELGSSAIDLYTETKSVNIAL